MWWFYFIHELIKMSQQRVQEQPAAEPDSVVLIKEAVFERLVAERRAFENPTTMAQMWHSRRAYDRHEFLSNLSHDLRTPLNAIMGFSALMKEGIYGPVGHAKYAEYVQHIHHSSEELLGTIRMLMDMIADDTMPKIANMA